VPKAKTRKLKPRTAAPREERGWMNILRASADFQSAGGEDEAFVVIYRNLDKAKEECVKALKETFGEELETDEIEWGEDQESSATRKVYFGRPKGSTDGYFQVYQVWIE